MRRLALVVSCLAAAVALSGCVLRRSPVPRTYVLESSEARKNAGQPSAQTIAVVGVARVSLPSWLESPTLMASGADGEIVADELSRWGEPLGRGVLRVVVDDLATLLPDWRVLSEPFPPRQHVDYRVQITLRDATRHADGTVLVEARWEVLTPAREALVRRRSSHRANPAGAGAAADVVAITEALGALSREIADAVRALPPMK